MWHTRYSLFNIFSRQRPAEVRSTKTGLASTVADLVREKEDSERESAAAQQMLMRLKDELETVRRQVELERSRADDSKKETEVCVGLGVKTISPEG